MKYAGLVIDNKSDQTDTLYTYGCSDDVRLGQKVYVSFGRSKKLRPAYVFSVSDEPEAVVREIIAFKKENAITIPGKFFK